MDTREYYLDCYLSQDFLLLKHCLSSLPLSVLHRKRFGMSNGLKFVQVSRIVLSTMDTWWYEENGSYILMQIKGFIHEYFYNAHTLGESASQSLSANVCRLMANGHCIVTFGAPRDIFKRQIVPSLP